MTPSGIFRRRERLAVPSQHSPFRVARRRAPAVIVLVGGQVDPMVLLEPLQSLEQAILSITRDRLRQLGAVRLELTARDPRPLAPPATAQDLTTEHERFEVHVGICGRALLHRSALALLQPALRVRQRLPATLRRAQRLGQLIAPSILPMQPILGLIGLLRLAQDLRDQVPVGAVLIHRGVRLDLRPVDRDHPNRHEARFSAQAEDIIEQLSDLRLVAAAELGDRGVIRRPHPRDHLERDVLPARPLDPTRRPVPARIRVEQQCDHHLRVVGRPARATQARGRRRPFCYSPRAATSATMPATAASAGRSRDSHRPSLAMATRSDVDAVV
jgi:hypothetical protein